MLSAGQILGAPTLCGHDRASQKISDPEGRAVMCTPCFRTVTAIRDNYLAGRCSLRAAYLLVGDIAGHAEARSYARQLLWARLVIRMRRGAPVS